ncbi:MAG TPA: isochorismate lyase [Nodosilinea sp.]|nr:isochorismate lyase [Nodosilinea sp.]
MKRPADCESMADIRAAIDDLDHQVMVLLAQRFEYVKAAAPFKTDAAGVKAPERLQAMLHQRRLWATELGLDPDVIERLYRDLVEYFIAEELRHWQAENR